MNLYEVTVTVGDGSDIRWVTTQVSAGTSQQARAMVEAQYGSNCWVHSVYQKS